MKIKIKDLVNINKALNNIKTNKIEIEDLKAIIKLKFEIKKELELVITLQEEIFKRNGVIFNEETLKSEYSDESVKDNFNKDIIDMNNTLVELENTNLINEESFYNYMKDSNIELEVIMLLEDILVIK